jgi:hypothetical protein
MMRGLSRLLPLALAATLLYGCGADADYDYPEELPGSKGRTNTTGRETGGLFGPDGIVLFGGSKEEEQPGGGSPIAVNSYLWRASLDTVSFMPLSSADPFGGVIITDWYAPPETEGERFKLNIYILGRDLRADGIRAAVFRQRLDPFSGWIDAKVEAETATDLEDAILTRARQLRISGLAQ